ncbi:MAG: glycoside hydrolase family 5 protein [Wujia sp.]
MKLRKRCLAVLTALTMVIPLGLGGCGKSKKDTTEETTQNVASDTDVAVDTENFIELALNVYYNDADNEYYSNESGESIVVTEEGQYTLSFDCSKDLSEEAQKAGVTALNNLTAIYILDMGSANGAQSPLKACNIMYDAVAVDGVELTITQTEPKSAFKTSGIFDTNDPINAWDGSSVEEVSSTSEHVANFTTVDNPTTISVTFTLSDMDWDGTGSAGGSETEVSSNTYVNTAKFSDIDFTSMNAVEFTKYLGNGINLGNTMEAVNTNYGKDLDVSQYEQAWGQPITTEDMIVGMKNCGFDTIRIPVAWTNMMDYENGDYTINTAYIDRVQEIVDWAIDAEMFVIINDHWDGGWWDLFAGDAAEQEQAWKIYESIWTQISERFADYSDMLIFESANEELGNNWLNQGLTDDEAYKLMNEINQKFIDIVRPSGGNNDDRFLLIAGNNTNIDLTLDNRFVMPTDTVKGKLLVSVHYYDPWNYCGDKQADSTDALEGYRWGLVNEYEYMNNQVSKMKKFVDEGYGVIIGEYGALPAYIGNTNYQIPNTVEYTDYFLDVCDVNNFCPVLWSTGSLYNKTTLNMISDELTELYTSRCYAEEEAAGDGYLDTVKANMEAAVEAAPEQWEGIAVYEPGTPVAWIMWNGGAGTYSVGDTYNPADNTVGITAHDVVVDGAGEYTISLDFEGGNDGITFAAIGLADGELLYPNAIIDIKEITVDGKVIEQVADDYTSSDDAKCTRVNLYNAWVNKLPDDARNIEGDLSNAAPVILDPNDLQGIKNISITFELVIE